MKIKPISEIQEFLSQIAIPLGIEVVEVEFKQGKNPAMTIYINKEGGVDLDTCEIFHREDLLFYRHPPKTMGCFANLGN